MGCTSVPLEITEKDKKLENYTKRVIWIDENIYNNQNEIYVELLKQKYNIFVEFTNLEDAFVAFYSNKFFIIITIISGKLWGRYLSYFKQSLNKIVDIPYTIIFTSDQFKDVLLNKKDPKREMSYDTINGVNDPFYNPGGVVSCFEDLVKKIESIELKLNGNIKERRDEKYNNEGLLTFEYLQNEEDLIAPALYKDIIINEPIQNEELLKLKEYLLSFNNQNLKELILNLNIYNEIPLEILSKYLARCYTFDSDFYKVMNKNLMKSEMQEVYKTFIKILYMAIEKKIIPTFEGKNLYRGAKINKTEYDKIISYKKKGKIRNVIVFSKAFLSFSEKEKEAISFINYEDKDKNTLRVLYELNNRNRNSTESNANIQDFSAYPKEKEILFLPGSSFVINDIITIKEGFIKISLNYYGKFMEYYPKIYYNKVRDRIREKNRFNELIKTNSITKLISGKEFEFLNDGEYLILEKYLDGTNNFVNNIMKAKNLKNNEIVIIKEINKKNIDTEKNFNQLRYLLKKANDISIHTCILKNTFEIDDKLYMEVNIYDENLKSLLERKGLNKGLPPNLIKKILIQLELILVGLEKEIGERYINPKNILIKYTNISKDNFDVFINENGIYEFETDFYSIFFYHPDLIEKKKYNKNYKENNNRLKIKYQLFSLGMTIFDLYKNIIINSIKKENKLYSEGYDISIKIGELGGIKFISEKITKWLKDLKENHLNTDDELLLELIDDLTDEQEKIKSFTDVFKHSFFSQYKY